MKRFYLPAILLFFTLPVLAQSNIDIQLANEYYVKGEYDKARALYDDLADDPRNIPLIHNNYFNLLLTSQDYKTAERYIKRQLKTFPDNIYYRIDYGILMDQTGDERGYTRQFETIIDEVKKDQYKLRITAQYFLKNQYRDWALKAYQAGRGESKQQAAYALELANIYRLLNKKDLMVEEYLLYVSQNPSNINYVKNVLQNLLTEEEDLVSLENILIEKVQRFPNKEIYSDLLIWVNLQQKNFYGAFVQARAVDKRMRLDGSEVLDIGLIAMENKAYEDAIAIFEYIAKEHPSTINYAISRRMIIKAREGMVKNTFPINELEIRNLVADYEELIQELGVSNNSLEAMRSKALLHAFYLDEKEEAIRILNQIITLPRADPNLKALSKLDLGDIFILIGTPWESTLLYSQVEKSHKEEVIGYEAKLRNAKLSYYKGDFELAKAHLDVLKLATTREIANDALDLGLLIQNNTYMDSTDAAMKTYANIELMLFQNKRQASLDSLQQMLVDFPGHSLTDEVLYLMATVNRELGNFQVAVELLDRVVTEFGDGILGDDAYFLYGTIYHYDLDDLTKAQEVYQDLLIKYPGSVFVAESRKRFRMLRGDFIN